jgi:hypothetical protein
MKVRPSRSSHPGNVEVGCDRRNKVPFIKELGVEIDGDRIVAVAIKPHAQYGGHVIDWSAAGLPQISEISPRRLPERQPHYIERLSG